MWPSSYEILPRKKRSAGANTKAIFVCARPIMRVLLPMAMLLHSGPSFAQQAATVSISVKNHQFSTAGHEGFSALLFLSPARFW
jgi:hypothetical protein